MGAASASALRFQPDMPCLLHVKPHQPGKGAASASRVVKPSLKGSAGLGLATAAALEQATRREVAIATTFMLGSLVVSVV